MNLLKFLRRSTHVDAPVIQVNAPVALNANRPACQINPQVLQEAGLPPWLTTEEALDALSPVPAILQDHPEPILIPDDIGNSIFTPAAVLAPNDEVVLPVTYSDDPKIQELLLFSEQEAMRFPVGKRHRPVLGLGLSFEEDSILTDRGTADWIAVPLKDVQFDMIVDRSPNQTRVNNTELYSGRGVPEVSTRVTNHNFTWKNYSIVAGYAGRLFEPHTYTQPLSLVQALTNQAMDAPKAATYVPEPELYVGFNDAQTVWEVIIPALDCTNGQVFSVKPSKKQIDYIETQVLKGMPVYANAKGVVVYIPWKKQASFDIYVETRDGRVFAGCVPEFGKFYVPEGTEVTAGQLIAAGFPQQADLDGDGVVDSPLTPFVAGQTLSSFLSNNGGFKNVIMTVLKNSMRKIGGVVVAPFATVSRLVDRAVPDLALLVWQKNCHTKFDFQVDTEALRHFGVLPLTERRHGYGTAKRGISRDGLVIFSADQ